MHELSLAEEVIALAKREAEKALARSILEITIEIGDLSGVDADAFVSVLRLLVKDSLLSKTKINIIRIPGKGKCISCDYDFEMDQRMAACPKCQAFPSEVSGGREFRVLSLVIE